MKDESIERMKNKIFEITNDDSFDPTDRLEFLLNFSLFLKDKETYKENIRVLEEHRLSKTLKLDKKENL